jgi:hypothetical protein
MSEPLFANSLLLLHAAATLYMMGLVWFVQVVHYPLFALVGDHRFPTYEDAHTRRTSLVVGPPMLLELLTAAALVVWRPAAVPVAGPWIGFVVLGVIWISTFALQVPRHTRLAARFDSMVHRGLVGTNWIRTFGWSVRGILALFMVFFSMEA